MSQNPNAEGASAPSVENNEQGVAAELNEMPDFATGGTEYTASSTRISTTPPPPSTTRTRGT